MYHACALGRTAIIPLLIKAGADPNFAVHRDDTPLIAAVRNIKSDAIQCFIANCRPNSIDFGKITRFYVEVNAVSLAYKHNNLELLKIFIDAGADPRVAYANFTRGTFRSLSTTEFLEVSRKIDR